MIDDRIELYDFQSSHPIATNDCLVNALVVLSQLSFELYFHKWVVHNESFQMQGYLIEILTHLNQPLPLPVQHK